MYNIYYLIMLNDTNDDLCLVVDSGGPAVHQSASLGLSSSPFLASRQEGGGADPLHSPYHAPCSGHTQFWPLG